MKTKLLNALGYALGYAVVSAVGLIIAIATFCDESAWRW